MSSPKVDLQPELPSEKLMCHESPSLEKEITDADGKIYKLRIPDALDEFDLSAALGTQSTNMGLYAQAMPLIYVESIQGEAFRRPNSFSEIRAALKRIGRNGMRAIQQAVYKFTAAENANVEASLAEIKK